MKLENLGLNTGSLTYQLRNFTQAFKLTKGPFCLYKMGMGQYQNL